MKKNLLNTIRLTLIILCIGLIPKAQAKETGLIMTPSILVTPNPYMFDDTYIGETSTALFTFANTGTDPLDITDITFTNPAFSINYTSFTIEPGQSGELPVYFNPTTQGSFEGIMQIFSNDPVNNPYEVQLSGNGVIELNNGWEWINTGINFGLADIEFPQGQNQVGYAVGETASYNGDGMVIKTTDGGDTWTQLIFDVIPGLESLSFVDMETGYAAGWDGYMIKTTDGGNTWDTIVVATGLWYIRDIEFWDANNGVVLAYEEIYVTQDGGDTWSQGTTLARPCNKLTYADENTLYSVGSDNYIFKSSDGGYTWTQVYSGNLQDILLGVDFLNADYGIAVGDYGYILTTTDGGTTWTTDQQVGDQLLTGVYIWDEETAYVCGTPELLYITTDGGTTWNFDYNGNYSGNGFGSVTFTDNYTGFVCGSLDGEGIVLRKAGIAGGPSISVTPNPYVFDDTYVGETTTALFTFENTGSDPLDITDITFTNPAFSIDYTSFTIEPGQSGELPVYFNPTTQGSFEGTMQIFSNDPVNNPYEVQLSGNGVIELNNGWEWIETGFNFILMDIEFPEGQNQIGYSIGQSLTYNGVGIVIKTTDGGDTWEQLTPEGIPGLQGCSFLDVNTGYAAGWDGYLIKTIDGGATWDTIVVQNNIWQIADVEFRDVNHGIVTAWTDGTFVTEDGGQTWTESTGITTAPNMVTYADENTLFLVGGEDRINRSTDGGYTWTEVYGDGNTNFILLGVDFLDSNFGMAAGDYGHLYTTTDGGDTWTLSEPFGDELLHTPFIWDQDTIWVCGTPERVYKTTDGGSNWSTAYNGNWQKAFYRITFTDNYTGFICGGSGGIVLRKEGLTGAPAISVSPNPYVFDDTYLGETASASFTFENTGTESLVITDITFSDPAFSIDYTSFTIEPGESGELPVYFTPTTLGLIEGVMQIHSNDPVNNPYEVQLSGSGIVELIDGWQWIETGFNFILMDIQFPEGQNQIGYCVGQSLTYNGDGIVIKTTDSGQTWEQLTPDGIPGLMGMSFVDVNTGYAVGWDDYVIRTTDGGLTWDTLIIDSGMFSFYADIEFYDENNGVALYSDAVYITQDAGDSWTMGSGLTNSGYMIEYLDENTLVAVGNENYIFKSTDGGYNWSVKNSGSIGQVLLGVDFLNNQYGMAAGDYGNILTTTDGGETWTLDTQVGDNLLHTPFIWDEDTAWVVGTPELVYKTTDGGTNWNSAYSGNWQKAFYRITFTDNYTGFICGGSGGIVLRKEGLSGLDTQVFDLETGYQFISSGVIPPDPDMMVVMTDVLNDNLAFVRNSQGTMLRKIGPNWVNGIGDWIIDEGYLVKMNAGDSFAIEGLRIDPSTGIPVTTGYQFVSYFPEAPMDALVAFGSIVGEDLDFIRDSQGSMLRKIGPNWINGIGDAMPGEGYLVKMFADGEILYPAVAKLSGMTKVKPSYLIFEGGNAAEPVYTMYINGLEIGSEVAAYHGKVILGSMTVTSNNVFENALAVFSELNNGLGYVAGEPISLKVWSDNNVVIADFEMEPVYNSYVSNTYPGNDGEFSVVNITKGTAHSEELLVYPNPVSDKLYLENIKNKEIIIYDLMGNLKLSLYANTNTKVINVSDYTQGIYLIKIIWKEGITTEKFEVIK